MTSTSSPSIIDRQLALASVALCRGRKQSQAQPEQCPESTRHIEGGSSKVVANIQLLCARHNLKKVARFE